MAGLLDGIEQSYPGLLGQLTQMLSGAQPTTPAAPSQVADAGGGSVPPLQIENLLTQHSQGNLTNSQVRQQMPPGWGIDFRGSKYDGYRVIAPDGKEHFIFGQNDQPNIG